jgi:hypothetical protein
LLSRRTFARQEFEADLVLAALLHTVHPCPSQASKECCARGSRLGKTNEKRGTLAMTTENALDGNVICRDGSFILLQVAT